MSFLEKIKKTIRENPPSVVFSEGNDLRVIEAACFLRNERLSSKITLLGNPEEIQKLAAGASLNLNEVDIIDPLNSGLSSEFSSRLVELQPKHFDEKKAAKEVTNRLYFGSLFQESGRADLHVSGAVETSADVIRTYYSVIKTNRKEGIGTSFFIMYKEETGDTPEKVYFFADCAVNITPSPKVLGKIAFQIGNIARDIFEIEPRLVLLSYSTKGSGSGEPVDNILLAGEELDKLAPTFTYDYEFQADSALYPDTAKRKAPKSPVQGDANVFIFPSLEAGNIGYKIAEQFGGFHAYGPVMVGLRKDASDLSRGAKAADIAGSYLVTAYYHLKKPPQ